MKRVVVLTALGCATACSPGAATHADAAPVAPVAEVPRGARALADIEREFLDACNPKVPEAPAYCACGWEQMTKTFSEAELRGSVDDPAKVSELQQRIDASCKRSLPEATIKASFAKGCTGTQPGRAGYCDCTWSELRGHFSAADLADGSVATSDRFASQRHAAAKLCAPRLPEEVARERFMEGCVKEESLKPFCGCAWKVLRVEGSAAEIDGGHVDMTVAQPKVERTCAKLRPRVP